MYTRLCGNLLATSAVSTDCETYLVVQKVKGAQIELMEEEMRAAKQEAASQVAAARKEAAAAQEEARREAQRHGASTMATAIEREAALSANVADLRAEYEVHPSFAFLCNFATALLHELPASKERSYQSSAC